MSRTTVRHAEQDDEAQLKVSRARLLQLLTANARLTREWRRDPHHRSLTR